jgi:hypothetical protein
VALLLPAAEALLVTEALPAVALPLPLELCFFSSSYCSSKSSSFFLMLVTLALTREGVGLEGVLRALFDV